MDARPNLYHQPDAYGLTPVAAQVARSGRDGTGEVFLLMVWRDLSGWCLYGTDHASGRGDGTVRDLFDRYGIGDLRPVSGDNLLELIERAYHIGRPYSLDGPRNVTATVQFVDDLAPHLPHLSAELTVARTALTLLESGMPEHHAWASAERLAP